MVSLLPILLIYIIYVRGPHFKNAVSLQGKKLFNQTSDKLYLKEVRTGNFVSEIPSSK